MRRMYEYQTDEIYMSIEYNGNNEAKQKRNIKNIQQQNEILTMIYYIFNQISMCRILGF